MQRSRWFKFRLLHAAESEAVSCEHLVWDVSVYRRLAEEYGSECDAIICNTAVHIICQSNIGIVYL